MASETRLKFSLYLPWRWNDRDKKSSVKALTELIDLADNLYKNLPLIVISGNPESLLAKGADVYIPTGNPPEVCLLGLTPTTSTTVMTVIGDALVVSMMERIGFTSEDYAKRHHGGYLGDKSREQARLKK